MIGLFGGQITSHCQSVILDGERIEDVERRRLADADGPPRRKLSYALGGNEGLNEASIHRWLTSLL